MGWKIPWRRNQQPTPLSLSGKSHGQRSLDGYSPWRCKRDGNDSVTKHTHTIYCGSFIIFLWINTFTNECILYIMATHSSVLAWRIPGTGEPGRLPSLGSHRVGHDWSDLAAIRTRSIFCNKCTVWNVSFKIVLK